MGCFLACFGSSNHGKKRPKHALHVAPRHPNYGNQQQHIQPIIAAKEEILEKPFHLLPVPEYRSKPKEQLNLRTQKKVTFDSNVKTYEHNSVDDTLGIIPESGKQSEERVNENGTNSEKSPSASEGGSTLSSLGSQTPNHRYQNYRESDNEDEELDCELSDLDEDQHDEGDRVEVYDDEYYEEEYQSSHDGREFSPWSCSSMESRTKSPSVPMVNDRHDGTLLSCRSAEKETTTLGFNHGARVRGGYVHSVLNPIENTTQWKAVKARGTPTKTQQQKENFQKPKLDKTKNIHEVAVDASLSTWLISSQRTPPNKAIAIGLEPLASGASASSYGSNSVRSQEEKPIMGSSTVEKFKQFSASSSPRRSPTQTLDEKLLVSSVGVHGTDINPIENSSSASSFKGIPNTTSKYREDKRVNWHSTPFETRLERALKLDAAEAYASREVCL